MMDELEGTPVSSTPETEGVDWLYRVVFAGMMVMVVCIFILGLTASSGCITAAKTIVADVTAPDPTPTATPTEIPTPTPTPTPIPTESLNDLMLRTNGYHIREWLHVYREDVQGIDGEDVLSGHGLKDLSYWVTVYGYRFLPSYHYHDLQWGTRSFRLMRPEYYGNKFLFVYVNSYTDGDDVRMYGVKQRNFVLHINGSMYFPHLPGDMYNPIQWIKELEYDYSYDRSTMIRPFNYKIVQEAGTGIITAVEQDYIYGGRSNADDGYIIFEVPVDTKPEDVEVWGQFSNVGGEVWWSLV